MYIMLSVVVLLVCLLVKDYDKTFGFPNCFIIILPVGGIIIRIRYRAWKQRYLLFLLSKYSVLLPKLRLKFSVLEANLFAKPKKLSK
jgi:hypothetical protein